MDKKRICKIVLRLVLLFILYRFAGVAGTGTALLLLLVYGVACFLLRLCLSILYGLCATMLFLLFLALLSKHPIKYPIKNGCISFQGK